MASLTAYIDDSGSDRGQPVVVIGGVVANDSSWGKIEPAWRAILEKYGVGSFHASKLEQRYGEFRGWSKGDRAELMAKLIGLLRSQRCKVFAYGVNVEVFSEVIDELPHLDANPYILCLEAYISVLMTWVQRKSHAQPMVIMIEAGQSHHNSRYMRKWQQQLRTIEMRDQYRVDSIVTMFKSQNVLFEAADLVAYEMYKMFKSVILNKTDHSRPSWGALETMAIEQASGLILTEDQMRTTLKSCKL